MEDANWCLTCNRQLEPFEAEPSPLIADDDPFQSTDEEDETVSPVKAPPAPAPKAHYKTTRNGTVKARGHAHPMRKNHSSGKLAQRGKLAALSTAVNSAVLQAQSQKVVEVPSRPDWAYLYCSEECMRLDEQRARLGLANLEPPKSPRLSPLTPTSAYSTHSTRSESFSSRGGDSRRQSIEFLSASPSFSRQGSSTNLQALTPMFGSTPLQMRQRSHSPAAGRSQSEDLHMAKFDQGVSPSRLSSSVTSTHSQPMVIGTLRPESAAFMRPASLGRSSTSKSAATIGLTGTSVSAQAYEPPPMPVSPTIYPQTRPPMHRSSLSTSSMRFESGSPESPNSLFSRSSVSTAPSSSRWNEEAPGVDGPHDPSKSPIYSGYGLYHRLPRRNASSSSLSRSPPAHLYTAPAVVTGLTPLSQSYGPTSDSHGHTISDVFRAGQARRTASSASIAAMNPEASGPIRKTRPALLHFKHQSSGGASSDSSNDGNGISPLPSPAFGTGQGKMWANGKEGRRPSFVYEAMPETPSKTEMQRHRSEDGQASSRAGTSARRKRLFHFPSQDD